jgi:hypothetical protein
MTFQILYQNDWILSIHLSVGSLGRFDRRFCRNVQDPPHSPLN